MGIIKKIANFFSMQNYIKQAMEQVDRELQKYLPMSAEELLTLSDEELCSAAIYRLDQRINARFGEQRNALATEWAAFLSPAQRTVYCIDWLSGSISLGGIRNSLYDKSNDWAGAFAPITAQSLREISALEHGALWESLVTEQQLDLSSINYSKPKSPAEDHHAFEKFDKAFSKLPSLDPLLAAYIRKSIQEF